ncbi:MAG: SusD/RagB family nutrient-binding outer membrane lipoprotein [Draconibacterium sp.]|nr:SusD/RagB family nutrient-binding outer membrane lipoprotein [Draconibacterium sp.]
MKTYIKIQLVFVLALGMIIFNACTDDFERMNTRNSLVTEDLINVDLMFTRVQVYAIHRDAPNGMGGGNEAFVGMTNRGDSRPFTVGDAPGEWNSLYGNYARNLADIINICNKRNLKNGDNKLDNKIAMARIMKAWAFARVTEVYGDIPYSEACLPVEEAILQPKYDTQKSIYEDIFKELKEAAAQLNASNESYGSADLIYGGDVTKWKKLANSLRLRYALRVRYADAEMAKSNMSDLSEADLITSLDDDAFIMTDDSDQEWRNRNYVGLINSNGNIGGANVGKVLMDILIGNGTNFNPIDPRAAIVADTSWAKWPGTPGYEQYSSFGYRGAPLLGGTVVPVEMKYPWGGGSVSKFSAVWYASVIERPMLRSSEVYFALAEAALFGLKTGDADALYKKGMDQAIAWAQRLYANSQPQMVDYLKLYYTDAYPDWDKTWEAAYFADKEITQAEIDALKADAVYTLSGTDEEKHEMIMNQKLVALYPDGDEGWTEWRRTGYPRVLIGTDLSLEGDGPIPRRMPWPQNEQSVNGVNYEAALKAFGGVDDRHTRTWFDANPAAPHKHPGTVPTQPLPYVQ